MDVNLSIGKITVLAALACAVLFVTCGFGSIVETNQAGFVKVLQVPGTGTMEVYSSPGMFWQRFGSVTEYKVAGTYRFSPDEEPGDSSFSPPIEVQFSDAGIAKISGNARFDLPTSDEAMLKIHNKFRSYDNLTQSLIVPSVSEALILTASLMSSEDSYSGRRAEFGQLAWDQVLNGVYLTDFEMVEAKDETTGEKTTKRIVKIRLDAKGQPQRKPNPLKEYGITVSQFLLDKRPDYEEGVLAQIKTQRDAMMKTVTARADATKAEQDRITAEAQGKAEVMTAQYKAEVEKTTAVVNAQREKAVAETKAQQQLEVAKLEKEAAEQTKQKDILLGQGEAERKRLVLAADGALAQKLATYERVQAQWAAAYKERKVPTTVFGGGAGGVGSDTDIRNFIDVQTMKAVNDLNVDLSTKK